MGTRERFVQNNLGYLGRKRKINLQKYDYQCPAFCFAKWGSGE